MGAQLRNYSSSNTNQATCVDTLRPAASSSLLVMGVGLQPGLSCAVRYGDVIEETGRGGDGMASSGLFRKTAIGVRHTKPENKNEPRACGWCCSPEPPPAREFSARCRRIFFRRRAGGYAFQSAAEKENKMCVDRKTKSVYFSIVEACKRTPPSYVDRSTHYFSRQSKMLSHTAVTDIRTSTGFRKLKTRHPSLGLRRVERVNDNRFYFVFVPAAAQLLFEILPNLGVHL